MSCDSERDPVVATVFDVPVRQSDFYEDASTAQAAFETVVVDRFMSAVEAELNVVLGSSATLDVQGPFHESLSEESILEEKRNVRRLREGLRRTTRDGEDADTVYLELRLQDMMDPNGWRRLTETITADAITSLDSLASESVEAAREDRFDAIRNLVRAQALVDAICDEVIDESLARELEESQKYQLLTRSGDASADSMRESVCRRLAEDWLRAQFAENVRIVDPAYQTDLAETRLLTRLLPPRHVTKPEGSDF